MKFDPPSELKNYKNDKKAASKSSLPVRVLGWLSLLSFGTAVCFIFTLQGKKPIIMSSCIGFIVLFSLYIFFKIAKRQILCNQCRRIMDTIVKSWTPDEWKKIQGYDLLKSFKGADGKLYTTEREKQGGSTTYFIHAHIQRWYACRQCNVYFLNAKYSQEMIFSTIIKEDFEQAKQSLLTDIKASEKMKLAYKERLN